MKWYITSLFFLFFVLVSGQTQDTLREIQLNDVVVTAQFEPQALKKSVFNVKVVSEQDIKQLAAANLADVLNQYLNITLLPNGLEGRSTVSLFGLDGQYFKILVDNIPLVSDNGLGNSIDITQINLNDIERIEIIEGSMGVTHGANAVSGILNIITKKSTPHRWDIQAFVQEETVGREYGLFDRGRHIQNLRLAHKLSEKWYASAGVLRNDFTGFLGGQQGENHALNDGRRGYLWLPKLQTISNAFLQYKAGDYKVFYKAEYMNERVDFANRTVNAQANPPFGEIRWANDQRFFTQRWFHHLNSSGRWKDKPFTVSISYQQQERDQESFRYNITEQQEENNQRTTDQASKLWYSTGTLSRLFTSERWDAQLGYEVVMNEGFSRVTGENNFLKEVRKDINNYDAFFSTEYKTNEQLTLRSGVRYSLQNRFDNQYALSLGARYLLPKETEVRLGLGRSYRTPNFDELYSEIIFSGHYFVGNEDLKPESSLSVDVSVKRRFNFKALQWQSQLNFNFIDVNDRIEMALIELVPLAKSQYINVSLYQMINLAWTNQWQWHNWQWNFGASLVGISQEINNGEAVSDDRFLFTQQLNSSVSYKVPRWNSVFSAYFKYNGRQQQFVASFDEDGNPTFKPSILSPFSWLDASVRKSFAENRWELTLGARNLLDITSVNQLQPNAGAAHPSPNNLLLGYGRSYFVKLLYNLHF